MDGSDDIRNNTGDGLSVNSPHPLVRHLWPLGPDASPEARLAAVFAAYSEATGVQLSDPIVSDELRRVGQWLRAEELNMPTEKNGASISLLYNRTSRLKPLISPDIAAKVGWLQQAQCLTCIPAELSPLAISFAIRVRPYTAQYLQKSKPAKLKDLRDKIAANMAQRNLNVGAWAGYGLCVAIVAVIPEKEQMKDVDNLVKGLLDALHGSIYKNDRQIQHLSVQRVLHGGDEGWYKLRVTPVLDPREDVIDQVMRVGWTGQKEIVAE